MKCVLYYMCNWKKLIYNNTSTITPVTHTLMENSSGIIERCQPVLRTLQYNPSNLLIRFICITIYHERHNQHYYNWVNPCFKSRSNNRTLITRCYIICTCRLLTCDVMLEARNVDIHSHL